MVNLPNDLDICVFNVEEENINIFFGFMHGTRIKGLKRIKEKSKSGRDRLCSDVINDDSIEFRDYETMRMFYPEIPTQIIHFLRRKSDNYILLSGVGMDRNKLTSEIVDCAGEVDMNLSKITAEQTKYFANQYVNLGYARFISNIIGSCNEDPAKIFAIVQYAKICSNKIHPSKEDYDRACNKYGLKIKIIPYTFGNWESN